jgi:hypothetical protein
VSLWAVFRRLRCLARTGRLAVRVGTPVCSGDIGERVIGIFRLVAKQKQSGARRVPGGSQVGEMTSRWRLLRCLLHEYFNSKYDVSGVGSARGWACSGTRQDQTHRERVRVTINGIMHKRKKEYILIDTRLRPKLRLPIRVLLVAPLTRMSLRNWKPRNLEQLSSSHSD